MGRELNFEHFLNAALRCRMLSRIDLIHMLITTWVLHGFKQLILLPSRLLFLLDLGGAMRQQPDVSLLGEIGKFAGAPADSLIIKIVGILLSFIDFRSDIVHLMHGTCLLLSCI